MLLKITSPPVDLAFTLAALELPTVPLKVTSPAPVTRIAPGVLTVLPKVAVVPATTLTDVVPVTAPAKLVAPVEVTVPPRVTAPVPTVVTDAALTAAVKPIGPVEEMETAPRPVSAPTLAAPEPETVERPKAPFTAPVIAIAPPVVVRVVAAVRVTAPVREILPAVVLIVEPMPTAVAAKVTAPVVLFPAFAVIAALTLIASKFVAMLKLL